MAHGSVHSHTSTCASNAHMGRTQAQANTIVQAHTSEGVRAQLKLACAHSQLLTASARTEGR
eukprot:2036437-Pleurochrysis_carterae.AAC.1